MYVEVTISGDGVPETTVLELSFFARHEQKAGKP